MNPPPPPAQGLCFSVPKMTSLLHHFSTTPTSSISGLLFGDVILTTPLNLSDESSDTAMGLLVTVTDFLVTSSFFSSSGDINTTTLRSLIPPSSSLLGWFSGNSRSVLRPSHPQYLITSSLSSLSQFSSTIKVISNPNSDRFCSSSIYFNPCLFLLISSPPISDKKPHIKTHRLYQFITKSQSFYSISLKIDTNLYAAGFLVGKLHKLIDYEAKNTQSSEDLNVKIENLTTLIEQSSAKVLEQAAKQDLAVKQLRSNQISADKLKKRELKAAEQVLAGSLRREMVVEESLLKQTSELQQYKHEKKCSAIIGQRQEGKIQHLESILYGDFPITEFIFEELDSLKHEQELVKENFEQHPEVLKMKIDLRGVQDRLQEYQNFYEFGERVILMEEISSLRDQLLFSIDRSSASARKEYSLLQLSHSSEPKVVANLTAIPNSTEASAEANENPKSSVISLCEELRAAVEANRLLAEKSKFELDAERKCSKEMKDAMQLALKGNALCLERYADLEEKHVRLLERHRKIHDEIDDVKKAASKAAVCKKCGV